MAFSDSSRKPKFIVAAPVAHARLGDDLDAHHAGFVILGGERVGVEADLLDLILRRQPAAAESVDEDLRARPGHLRQLLRHLVGIVRQRVDVVLAVRVVREPIVATRLGALFADLDLFAEWRRSAWQSRCCCRACTVNGAVKP